MSNLSSKDVELLKRVADATNANTIVYELVANMAALQAAQLVEGNPNMIDPATGGCAYRATPAGLTYAQNLSAAGSALPPAGSPPVPPGAPIPPAAPAAAKPAPAQVANGFATGTGFQPPAKATRRSPNSGRGYPFETLELGGYIFVPATEKRPDPKKSLASTISSANKRFEEFQPRRYFKTYRAVKDQVFGSVVAPSDGAYIVRVEPPVDAPAETA